MFVLLPFILSLTGCSEQELKAFNFDDIAVVEGDFDSMNDVLVRLDISSIPYEGFITRPVYDEDVDPNTNPLKVENLLRDRAEGSDRTVMFEYDAIFINSGVRGFGEYEYDSVNPDDTFLSDPLVVENVRSYVEGGKTLILSDWAGDLIEAIWPEKIDFVNETTCEEIPCWDAPQVGLSELIDANVVPDDLQRDLESDNISISFDFSYWTAMASVADDVEVLLRGDIEYRMSDGEGKGELSDIPLLVTFPVDRGRVIFSSFHWRSQSPTFANQLMLYAVEGLSPGPNANLYGDE